MIQTERLALFDDWAKDYDLSVMSSESGFPFDGYEQILQKVVSLADVKPGMEVLDLGIGTGNLATLFANEGCSVWGMDFSVEMLSRTHSKFPQINLFQSDLLGDWPSELRRPFDRVVSAYVFHEFDLESKIQILQRIASQYLSSGSCIFIADIAFPSIDARSKASRCWADHWDDTEYYWAADETKIACEQIGLQTTYEQVSGCGGIFSFTIKD